MVAHFDSQLPKKVVHEEEEGRKPPPWKAVLSCSYNYYNC